MCLNKLTRTDSGVHFVYKVFKYGQGRLFSLFGYRSEPAELGKYYMSDRVSVEINHFERTDDKIFKGIHVCQKEFIAEALASLEARNYQRTAIVLCEVQPKDFVASGSFDNGHYVLPYQAVYMKVKPVRIIQIVKVSYEYPDSNV